MAFTMTFQGADTSDFTTGLVSLTVDITGAETPLDHEGAEQTTWNHIKGKAAIHRRLVRVHWRQASVVSAATSGADLDHGHYEAFMVLCRKNYKRIYDTDLPRVTRVFDSGVLSEPFSLWDGRAEVTDPPEEAVTAVAGLLPWLFDLSSVSVPKWDADGRMSITAELFSTTVEAEA